MAFLDALQQIHTLELLPDQPLFIAILIETLTKIRDPSVEVALLVLELTGLSDLYMRYLENQVNSPMVLVDRLRPVIRQRLLCRL